MYKSGTPKLDNSIVMNPAYIKTKKELQNMNIKTRNHSAAFKARLALDANMGQLTMEHDYLSKKFGR